MEPGTVVGDGSGCRSDVKEEARRQELGRGRQVGCDLLLEDRAGDLVDDSHPDGAAVRRCGDEQGEHATRGEGETCPHVG